MKNIFCLLMLIGPQAVAQSASSNCIKPATEQLQLMSFNTQINTSKFQVGPWKSRVQEIKKLIRSGPSHVIGFQEMLYPMLEDLSALLPEYGIISVGRDDGLKAGEHTTVFYLKSRLELIETKTFWLSRTPDVPGSKGWDAWSPRTVTWAQFRDLVTGKMFYVFNTHFDHWGETAQIESAKLLGSVSALMPNGLPHVVLGDFNVKPGGKVYEAFLEHSGLADAMTVGPHQGPNWTYSFFGTMKSKIDYVFVSANINVCEHRILPDDTNAPTRRSDHLPVSVLIEFGN